jgi:methionine synthase I (cobalamin-dependent)
VTLRGPAPLGRLVREQPAVVREHYHQEIQSGADVLCCLTGDTLPRALQQIGMPFRAAALTGTAVELALDEADLAPRPVIVAGMLGNVDLPIVASDRLAEELAVHAARLVTAGCELMLATGSAAWDAAVEAAEGRGLATWALATVDHAGFAADGEAADSVARAAFNAGAQLLLLEILSADVGLAYLDRLLDAASRGGEATAAATHHVGFALAAGSHGPDAWGDEVHRLLDAGVRVVGCGRGATNRHLAAVSARIRGADRQSLWPRAV